MGTPVFLSNGFTLVLINGGPRQNLRVFFEKNENSFQQDQNRLQTRMNAGAALDRRRLE